MRASVCSFKWRVEEKKLASSGIQAAAPIWPRRSSVKAGSAMEEEVVFVSSPAFSGAGAGVECGGCLGSQESPRKMRAESIGAAAVFAIPRAWAIETLGVTKVFFFNVRSLGFCVLERVWWPRSGSGYRLAGVPSSDNRPFQKEFTSDGILEDSFAAGAVLRWVERTRLASRRPRQSLEPWSLECHRRWKDR